MGLLQYWLNIRFARKRKPLVGLSCSRQSSLGGRLIHVYLIPLFPWLEPASNLQYSGTRLVGDQACANRVERLQFGNLIYVRLAVREWGLPIVWNTFLNKKVRSGKANTIRQRMTLGLVMIWFVVVIFFDNCSIIVRKFVWKLFGIGLFLSFFFFFWKPMLCGTNVLPVCEWPCWYEACLFIVVLLLDRVHTSVILLCRACWCVVVGVCPLQCSDIHLFRVPFAGCCFLLCYGALLISIRQGSLLGFFIVVHLHTMRAVINTPQSPWIYWVSFDFLSQLVMLCRCTDTLLWILLYGRRSACFVFGSILLFAVYLSV